VERLRRKSSRAKLVRRHDIPKEHGTLRPLGIPAVEDKLRQLAVTRLLTAIDEPEFRRCSDGYRPHLGALDAVDKLTITLQCGRDHWVVEAEITGVFDHIKHEGRSRMLAARIDDQALRWLSTKGLKAGVLDTDGQVLQPVTGTPHGGIRSPILAHVYLHDALDLWCEPGVTRRCRGEACRIRDADDFVCALEKQEDAERFYTALGQRLGKFGLELSAEKTRVISCSRQPPVAKTSFEFLGFEFRWGKDRAGQDHFNRRTSRTKLRNSRKRCTQWCKTNRHPRRGVLCARLNAKLRGYDNDYGVHGNVASLNQFFFSAMGILQQWLNRRSQRRSYTWAGYTERLARFTVERPRIGGRPQSRLAASRV
jgi:RNA-directed DNA polymerase